MIPKRPVIPDGTESATPLQTLLEFLRQDSHGYPLELLRTAGVDMSSSEPIDRALATYGECLAELDER